MSQPTQAAMPMCPVPSCTHELRTRRMVVCDMHFKQLPRSLADTLYFTWVLANRAQREGSRLSAQRHHEGVLQRAFDHIAQQGTEAATTPAQPE